MTDLPTTAATEVPASQPVQPPTRSRHRFRKFFLYIWLPLIVLFVGYLFISYRATGFDRRILTTDSQVTVSADSSTIAFTPRDNAHAGSLIFIPGAMVDPNAYAPLAHGIAEHGYAVTILKLPMRFASLESQRDQVSQRAKALIDSGGPNTQWVVAGHSLGGLLASRVARDHPTLLKGLVLIGTSHPRDFSLADRTLDVTKVMGTNDGVASPAAVKANASKLPLHTRWVTIEGGNHSQFGYYGFQIGDHRATITREDQQAQTLRAILDTLESAERAK